MLEARVDLRKALLGCTVSVLALSIAAPAYAGNNGASGSATAQPSSAVPAGTNSSKDEIVVTGLRASIQQWSREP